VPRAAQLNDAAEYRPRKLPGGDEKGGRGVTVEGSGAPYDDVARLRANWRNRAIEAALNGSVPMLRVWRALVPAWDEHRGESDCTHLGLNALAFVAEAIHVWLARARWA
jgi:hypothetical protein